MTLTLAGPGRAPMKQVIEASSDRTKPYPGDLFPEKSCGAPHYDSPVAAIAGRRILLRKDMGVLMDSVREGRKTFINILKYTTMATSSHFGNMLSMAGGVPFLPLLPMQPIQIFF